MGAELTGWRAESEPQRCCQLYATTASDVPSLPGAYVLVVQTSKPLKVAIAGNPTKRLDAGRYLYCGSAWGPGGLKARVARHMRRGKAIRWHVDRLTEAGTVVGSWIFPGGDECHLAAALARLPVPIKGFGSSDCASCRSHLFYWPDTKPIDTDQELGPTDILYHAI